jgi:hypothetical protein
MRQRFRHYNSDHRIVVHLVSFRVGGECSGEGSGGNESRAIQQDKRGAADHAHDIQHAEYVACLQREQICQLFDREEFSKLSCSRTDEAFEAVRMRMRGSVDAETSPSPLARCDAHRDAAKYMRSCPTCCVENRIICSLQCRHTRDTMHSSVYAALSGKRMRPHVPLGELVGS